LFLENTVEAEVISDTGDNGSIGAQGQSGQRGAVDEETVDEFRGNMLGIGGATPVAHQHKLMPSLKGLGDQTGAVNQPLSLGFKEKRLQAVKSLQMLLNRLMHRYENNLFKSP
jgi:hypothetical protein